MGASTCRCPSKRLRLLTVLLQSWFIGKVPTSSGTPATPNAITAPNLTAPDQETRYNDLSSSQQAQVSPMSSAFPPIQSRAAVA